jgi:GntR family transcriptional regulator, negative regulator for fad regulon and positive regulator of fabA
MNPSLPAWPTPQKPSEIAYKHLLKSILDGSMPADSLLPSEVQLAEALGVTRSTLREALQRLAANGMVEIRHGKPTRVRDIWVEGNMNTLSSVVSYQYEAMSARWVPQMLEVRLALAPAYARAAVEHNAPRVSAMLAATTAGLSDDSALFAQADWDVHQKLAILSDNPIFTLILNGFREYYRLLAERYFLEAASRAHSRTFYRDLQLAAQQGDAGRAYAITQTVMAESLQHWLQLAPSE